MVKVKKFYSEKCIFKLCKKKFKFVHCFIPISCRLHAIRLNFNVENLVGIARTPFCT